jgi:hypothetical protein
MQNNALSTPTPPSGPIDYSSTQGAASAANNAAQNVANLTSSSPDLLRSLQQNLTGIFTNNNPVMAARDTALTNYLNTPSATRASLLSSNLPMVAGSNLNLSPTQQNAIVQGRENAALVPLLGLNSAVTGMYGNIPQMVANAGNIYQGILGGAKTLADLAENRYQQSTSQAEAQNAARFQQQQLALQYANNPTLNANRILQAAGAAARNGASLNDILANFGTNAYVTPGQILQTYNAANSGNPAQLTLPQALGLGISPQSAGVMPLQSVQVRQPGPIPFLPGLFSSDITELFNPLTGQYSSPNSGGSWSVVGGQ